jgi:exodeoxyribonuclease V alpha subunit
MSSKQVFAMIDDWITRGCLSQLDKAFAGFLHDQEPNANQVVLWAGALVSHQLGRGEVYLDLEKLCLQPGLTLALSSDDSENALCLFKTESLDDWLSQLEQSVLVASGIGNTPLVLQNKRLYLRRYWQYQQTLDRQIGLRLQPVRNQLPTAFQQTLQQLFNENQEQPDWQKIACVLAMRSRFAIITGGPGTGKTTTLTKLLSLLIQLAKHETDKPKLTILLAAPTGKAAARVSESITNALEHLQMPEEIKQQIPKKASTLHRMLGSHPESRRFQHNRHNPLLADIVIVDEASMIDLEMMASLLDALPASTQLILLGDKDQLASVEAGSVMGDLCQAAEYAAYDQATLQWISRYSNESLSAVGNPGSAINQQTVMLRYSHRFGEHSGIGQLARAVNAGNAISAQSILSDTETYPDLKRLALSDSADTQFKQLVLAVGDKQSTPGYRHYLNIIFQQRPKDANNYEQWALDVLQAFDLFQVLCALRSGDWGVEGLNQRIEKWLFPEIKNTLWYAGRPVMITRNDYNLGLMNGDIGITLPNVAGKLRVAFPGNENSGKIRWVSPMRLPDVETAFAMTVHKSQGSEFNHVALILPDTRSPVLTRELIYTGITRAKEHFSLLECRSDIFAQAIALSCK